MLNKKIIICGLLFSFSLLMAMKNEDKREHDKQLVLYKNVHQLKKAQNFKKHTIFIFNCLGSIENLNSSSGKLPCELTHLMKYNTVVLYCNTINKPQFYLQGSSQCQSEAIFQLSLIDSYSGDLILSRAEIEQIKKLPCDIVRYALEKEKVVCVDLPWYQPSFKQKKHIRLDGLTGGLLGCISFLCAMYSLNGCILLPIKHLKYCLGSLAFAGGIGGFMWMGLRYIKDVLFSEKKRYDKYIISPDPLLKRCVRFKYCDE